MPGTFNISREIFDHPIVGKKHPERFVAWCWMLSAACWRSRPFEIKGRIVILQRGQFATSFRRLAAEWGWSVGAVQRFLTRLKTDTMIDTLTDTGQLIVTICNYDAYQAEPSEPIHEPEQKSIQQRYSSDTQKNKGNKGKKNKDNPQTPLSILCEVLPDDLARDFIDHRKLLRFPLGNRGARGVVNSLIHIRDAGHIDPAQAIEQAFERGWRTVKLEWLLRQGPSGKPPKGTRDAKLAAAMRDAANEGSFDGPEGASGMDYGSGGGDVVDLHATRHARGRIPLGYGEVAGSTSGCPAESFGTGNNGSASERGPFPTAPWGSDQAG